MSTARFQKIAPSPGYSLTVGDTSILMDEQAARALSRSMLEFLGLTVEHFNHDTSTQNWLFPELADPNEGVRPLSETEKFSHSLFWDALYGVSHPLEWKQTVNISGTTLTRKITHPMYSRVAVVISTSGLIGIAAAASGQPSVDISLSRLAQILKDAK